MPNATDDDARDDVGGQFPDTCPVALVLIDFINPMDFEGGERLLAHALPAAEAARRLKAGARAHGVPVIYANDNFGRWQADFSRLVERCTDAASPGHPVARRLVPEADDYTVLKPKYSAFFHTTLETLLRHLGTRTLVLAGLTTDICVLFTANDAYLRSFRLLVPSDAVAAVETEQSDLALAYLRRVLDADTRPSDEVDWQALADARADG